MLFSFIREPTTTYSDLTRLVQSLLNRSIYFRLLHTYLKMVTNIVKTWAFLLLIPMVMCAVPRLPRYSVPNEKMEHMDSNALTPPQDPAVNTIPKKPVVPLLPTCVRPGYFRDPFNCGKFYYCLDHQSNPAAFYCQQGLIFNELTDVCDDPNYVDC